MYSSSAEVAECSHTVEKDGDTKKKTPHSWFKTRGPFLGYTVCGQLKESYKVNRIEAEGVGWLAGAITNPY